MKSCIYVPIAGNVGTRSTNEQDFSVLINFYTFQVAPFKTSSKNNHAIKQPEEIIITAGKFLNQLVMKIGKKGSTRPTLFQHKLKHELTIVQFRKRTID
jgi:hypothetical protein